MPRAHIFTDIDPAMFTKQAPDGVAHWRGVDFTIGMDLDPGADVLILFTRAGWTIPTHLPRSRTVFIAGEPEDIHPYSAAFLNQFGRVVAPGEKSLSTKREVENYCSLWFAGVNFDDPKASLGYDHFKSLKPPAKDDRISIVTSRKASTPYHRRRLEFIDYLKEKIPDRIVLYGREFNPVVDKKDALLPHKYHLALENGAGRYSWTEKLSDPLLCWALPLYVGCENVADELPTEAIVPLSLDDFDAALTQLTAAIDGDAYSARLPALAKARDRLLSHHNMMALCARMTKAAMAETSEGPAVTIRSEKSLWPEPGARGSVPQMLLRRAILAVNPRTELQIHKLRRKLRGR